jgi:hypothetical protein
MEKINGKYGNSVVMPKAVTASDKTGSQGHAKKNIPAAKTNATGKDEKYDGGRQSGSCYTHDRKSYQ